MKKKSNFPADFHAPKSAKAMERILREGEDEVRTLTRKHAQGDVQESNIARFEQHASQHDVGMITGFRTLMEKCLDETLCTSHVNTLEENRERNRVLQAILWKKGYGTTDIDGSYVEGFGEPGAREVAEHSYFVVNLKDHSHFMHDLARLGEVFCQDSVFLRPRGKTAYLLGTNLSWPGRGNRIMLPHFRGGVIPGPFFSRIRGRPFAFESREDYGASSRWLQDLFLESSPEYAAFLRRD